jgi:hypothetical protein
MKRNKRIYSNNNTKKYEADDGNDVPNVRSEELLVVRELSVKGHYEYLMLKVYSVPGYSPIGKEYYQVG